MKLKLKSCPLKSSQMGNVFQSRCKFNQKIEPKTGGGWMDWWTDRPYVEYTHIEDGNHKQIICGVILQYSWFCAFHTPTAPPPKHSLWYIEQLAACLNYIFNIVLLLLALTTRKKSSQLAQLITFQRVACDCVSDCVSVETSRRKEYNQQNTERVIMRAFFHVIKICRIFNSLSSLGSVRCPFLLSLFLLFIAHFCSPSLPVSQPILKRERVGEKKCWSNVII